MHTWQLQEAKSRFSEVVDLSLTKGPQMVTRRGHEAVVILAARDFRRLSGHTVNLLDCLLDAPRGPDLLTDRSSEAIRDIAL
jgi:antitoxin Phd